MYQLGEDAIKVPMELFAVNRRNLLDRLRTAANLPESAIIVLQGGVKQTRNCTDIELLFRQESYFHWCFGVTESGFYGAIEVDTGKAILFAPKWQADYAIWVGKVPSLSFYQEKYCVDEVHFTNEITEVLRNKNPNVLLTLYGLNTDSGNYCKEAHFEGIETFNVDNKILHPNISECRVFKTKYEVEVLRYTNSISSAGFKEIMKSVKPGMFEFQLESIFQDYCYRVGACRHSTFIGLCTCGHSTSILSSGIDGHQNDQKITEDSLCLLDMGAEYYCYTSDIACTFPSTGKFSPKQRFLYETVLRASRAIHAAIAPGLSFPDMHLMTERIILEEFARAGLLCGDVEEMLEQRVAAVFFPHSLGHFLGVDAHDVGGYPEGYSRIDKFALNTLRTVRKLEVGMVFAVEPGAYFMDYLIDEALADPKRSKYLVKEEIDKFRGIGGVRIEDNVYLGENGPVVLTDLPRTIDEIETFMKENNVHLKEKN